MTSTPTPTAAQYVSGSHPADATNGQRCASKRHLRRRLQAPLRALYLLARANQLRDKRHHICVGASRRPVRSVHQLARLGDFKPGSVATPVKADQTDQDDAYLYFGVWSSIPDNISWVGYNFRYVAGGGDPIGAELTSTSGDLANINALIGPATFRGGAVGKYVTQGQVGGQNAKIGTFTATATLNADFESGTAILTPLAGSITDFREGGSPLAGWRVTLGGGGSPADVGVAMPHHRRRRDRWAAPWQTSAACRWEVHGAPPSTAATMK